jgi:hypothetical protein
VPTRRCRFSLERLLLGRRGKRRVRGCEYLSEVLTCDFDRRWAELAKERIRGLARERADVEIRERGAAAPEAVEMVYERDRPRLRLG